VKSVRVWSVWLLFAIIIGSNLLAKSSFAESLSYNVLSQSPSYSIPPGAAYFGRYHWVSSTIIQIEMEAGDQNLWNVFDHKFIHQEAVRQINRRFRGDQLLFSPDCRWVLATNPNRNKGYCASLEGKQTLSFRGSDARWFDSHRWGAIRLQKNSGNFALEIRDVSRKESLTYSFKRRKKERNFNLTLLPNQQVVGDPLLVSWEIYNRSQSRDSLELSVWNYRGKVTSVISYNTKTPDGRSVSGPIAFSPDGKRIVWETLASTKDGKICTCFRVTDIDGKNAFSAKQLNYPGSEERPHHSRWLPDSKNFSFIHKNRLYIVPVQYLKERRH